MHILNKRKRDKETEKKIYEIARFLDTMCETSFNFQFDYDHSCSYGREHCDMKCGPSEYLNCNMDAPVEYLYQTTKQVNSAIDDECAARNIILADCLYEAAVQLACNSAKIEEEHQQLVRKKFGEIKNGKGYEISINYKGETDPFINVLQEMLYTGGYIYTESCMVIGEHYNPASTPEEQKEAIISALKILQSHLDDGKYPEIKKLLINKDYPVKSAVMNILSTMVLCNGQKLADKIHSLGEFSPTKYQFPKENNHLMEAFISIRRGYMDWNTAQAIWCVNQELRPKEPELQWTVDKSFLEALTIL
jgi:hypothetical protein